MRGPVPHPLAVSDPLCHECAAELVRHGLLVHLELDGKGQRRPFKPSECTWCHEQCVYRIAEVTAFREPVPSATDGGLQSRSDDWDLRDVYDDEGESP